MKRLTVALAAVLTLGLAAPAHADPVCNIKALHNTGRHLMHVTDPVRRAKLEARYARLVALCTAPRPR